MLNRASLGLLIQLAALLRIKKKNEKIHMNDMGIVHPPRVLQGAAAGLGRHTATSGGLALPWFPVVIKRLVSVIVVVAMTITVETRKSSHGILSATHLKGRELPGLCMLGHARGNAPKCGLLISTVRTAMAKPCFFFTRAFCIGSVPCILVHSQKPIMQDENTRGW